MNEPVRILSDLHLGHKVSRIKHVAALRPLIAGAATVIFNGDTWQELMPALSEHSAAMLDQLKALCSEEGANPVFLSGNHDPGWPGPGWIELAGGRIIVTHGDALLHSGSPWKREILASSDRIIELWKQYPAADHDARQRILLARAISRTLCAVERQRGSSLIHRAWDAAMPPQRAIKMLQAWFSQGASGSQFCDRYFPQAKALVIGHFHHHGAWLRNRRLIVNTGSFTNPGRAHWVEWNQSCLSRGAIDESPKLCRIGRTLNRWQF